MGKIKEDLKVRDSVDFASEPVGQAFRRMLWPTLLGMVSMVVLNLTDGAFVGHGAGAEALAAVNIAAPIFNLMTGIGIMFGIGASIVASVHLAQGNTKAANINITQALIGSVAIAAVVAALILSDLPRTCRLFGSNEALIPLASSYLRWIAFFMPLQMLGMVGGFIVRLDGSPKFSMSCTLVASILNIILDFVFIFPLGMGLEGAAIATSISFAISAMILMWYVVFRAERVHLYRLRLTLKSFVLTLRNIFYQIKAGFSAMLGEVAVSGAIIVGNFVFVSRLGEAGVAAYSVACYCMPIIFMFANAIVQSIQPIVSYAHGAGATERLQQAKDILLRSGLAAGFISMAVLALGAKPITMLFMSPSEPAFQICVNGLPYFSIAALFVALNLVFIGYFQSIERSGASTFFTLLRGFIIVIPTFLLLPRLLGTPGIWLSIPLAEALTLLVILVWSRFE